MVRVGDNEFIGGMFLVKDPDASQCFEVWEVLHVGAKGNPTFAIYMLGKTVPRALLFLYEDITPHYLAAAEQVMKHCPERRRPLWARLGKANPLHDVLLRHRARWWRRLVWFIVSVTSAVLMLLLWLGGVWIERWAWELFGGR